MKDQFRIMLVGLSVAVLGLIAWAFFHAPEPSHRGKSISAWVKELGYSDFESGGLSWEDWPLLNVRQNPDAAEAIRQIGSAGFPYLLNALTNKDPAWKITIAGALPGPLQNLVRLRATPRSRAGAVLALNALGKTAESVTPDLTQALYTFQSAKAAAVALSAIGPRGWKVLTQAINGTNEWSALYSVWALAHQSAVVPGTLDALMSATTNRSATVSSMASWALGKIGQDKEHVIPFLVTTLGATNTPARFGAMWGIGWFGTNAISAVPVLLSALQDPDITIRDGAGSSLRRIDPEAAIEAGLK